MLLFKHSFTSMSISLSVSDCVPHLPGTAFLVLFLGFYRGPRALIEFLQHWLLFLTSYKQLNITCRPERLPLPTGVCSPAVFNPYYPNFQTYIGKHKMKFLQQIEVQVTRNISKECSFFFLPYHPLLSHYTWKNNESIAQWKIHFLSHARCF